MFVDPWAYHRRTEVYQEVTLSRSCFPDLFEEQVRPKSMIWHVQIQAFELLCYDVCAWRCLENVANLDWEPVRQGGACCYPIGCFPHHCQAFARLATAYLLPWWHCCSCILVSRSCFRVIADAAKTFFWLQDDCLICCLVCAWKVLPEVKRSPSPTGHAARVSSVLPCFASGWWIF